MTRIDSRPPAFSSPAQPSPPSPRASHRAPASTARQVVSAALIGAALLQVWLVFYALVLTPLQAHHSQGVLYSQFREQLAGETAPVGGKPIDVGAPVAIMDFPGAGIHREVVVEGTDSSDLQKGVGHQRNSVLPGQVGYTVLQGRAQLYGGPFGDIASAKLGSTVTFTTGEGVSRYEVFAVQGPGAPKVVAPAGATGILKMYTGASSGWRSGWAPAKAVIVFAVLKSQPYPGQAGAAIPKSELPMEGDPGALYVLVLWIPLLLASVLGVMWAMARWGRWQAWLVGVPVVLATLWGFGQAVLELLPNLT